MKINKIEEVKPEFNKMILLIEHKDGKNIVNTGYLQSVDINGCKWITQDTNFSNIFGGIGTSNFKPQYWAEIDLTEIDELIKNI
jgi:hypothetical protein